MVWNGSVLESHWIVGTMDRPLENGLTPEDVFDASPIATPLVSASRRGVGTPRVPSIFVVNTLADNGSNSNPTSGSLRTAIVGTNGPINPSMPANNILFNVTGTITPPTPLPTITRQVAILSSLSSTGAPLVLLDGSKAGFADGLWITAPGCVVYGLAIDNFQRADIYLAPGANASTITGDYLGLDRNGNGTAPRAPTMVMAMDWRLIRIGTPSAEDRREAATSSRRTSSASPSRGRATSSRATTSAPTRRV